VTSTEGGGGEIVMLTLSWVVTNALTFLIVMFDERRMSADKLERAWPPQSRDAAIVMLSVLALPVHFAKTRGHLKSISGALGFPLGIVMGLIAATLVVVGSSLVLEGVAWIFGISAP
jgi:hypothetical protein